MNAFGSGNPCAGASLPKEVRPYEQSANSCHDELGRIEALITDAEYRLAPVLTPAPPEGKQENGATGYACSDVIISVNGLAERIANRLSALLCRVHV